MTNFRRTLAAIAIAILLAAALLGAAGEFAPAVLILVGLLISFAAPVRLAVFETCRVSSSLALASAHLRAPPRRRSRA